MKNTLNWSDLHRLGDFDNANRFTAINDIAIEYIEIGGYRTPSRAWPYSHAKPLLTKKFAKWLINNHPEFAEEQFNLGE